LTSLIYVDVKFYFEINIIINFAILKGYLRILVCNRRKKK
jgi:hypothetical protein